MPKRGTEAQKLSHIKPKLVEFGLKAPLKFIVRTLGVLNGIADPTPCRNPEPRMGTAVPKPKSGSLLATFDFPVISEAVAGASVKNGDPALESAFTRAARRRIERGAVCIREVRCSVCCGELSGALRSWPSSR